MLSRSLINMQSITELTLCLLIHRETSLICLDSFVPMQQLWETNSDVAVEMKSVHCNEALVLVTSSQACLKR